MYIYRDSDESNAEYARRLAVGDADNVRDTIAAILDRRDAERDEAVNNATERLRHQLLEANSRVEWLENADIEPNDPRVQPTWRKARRIADNAGFCEEFDKIAEGLGIPQREYEWHAMREHSVTLRVPLPVSGIATAQEVRNGDYEEADLPDDYDTADALKDFVERHDARDLSYLIQRAEPGELDRDSVRTERVQEEE